jgi:hypothetical protein
MKRSFLLVLFTFFVGIFMVGCACFPCGEVAKETPPPQPAVVTPAPPPPPAPAPKPVPPPKPDRN